MFQSTLTCVLAAVLPSVQLHEVARAVAVLEHDPQCMIPSVFRDACCPLAHVFLQFSQLYFLSAVIRVISLTLSRFLSLSFFFSLSVTRNLFVSKVLDFLESLVHFGRDWTIEII